MAEQTQEVEQVEQPGAEAQVEAESTVVGDDESVGKLWEPDDAQEKSVSATQLLGGEKAKDQEAAVDPAKADALAQPVFDKAIQQAQQVTAQLKSELEDLKALKADIRAQGGKPTAQQAAALEETAKRAEKAQAKLARITKLDQAKTGVDPADYAVSGTDFNAQADVTNQIADEIEAIKAENPKLADRLEKLEQKLDRADQEKQAAVAEKAAIVKWEADNPDFKGKFDEFYADCEKLVPAGFKPGTDKYVGAMSLLWKQREDQERERIKAGKAATPKAPVVASKPSTKPRTSTQGTDVVKPGASTTQKIAQSDGMDDPNVLPKMWAEDE